MTEETTLADTPSSSVEPGRARADVAAWVLLVVSIVALAATLRAASMSRTTS